MGKKEVKGGKVKSKRWLGGLEFFSNRQAAKDFSPFTFPPFTRIDLIRPSDQVDPTGFSILYLGGSMSMSSRAAPAGIIGKTLSVLMHSALMRTGPSL
jgi:hypothetical protein